MFALQVDLVKGEYGRQHFGSFQNFIEVFDVFDLARLSYSVTFLFEALFFIELHCVVGLIEVTRIKKETADECAGSAFPMVAVDNTHVKNVLQKVLHNDFADDEQSLKLRSFVVLPIKRVNV
jgi:hypothetical protein